MPGASSASKVTAWSPDHGRSIGQLRQFPAGRSGRFPLYTQQTSPDRPTYASSTDMLVRSAARPSGITVARPPR